MVGRASAAIVRGLVRRRVDPSQGVYRGPRLGLVPGTQDTRRQPAVCPQAYTLKPAPAPAPDVVRL